MPFMDGTGPIGGGSLTSGQQGGCSGAGALAGRRNGRGHRNLFCAAGRAGWQRRTQASALAAGVASGSSRSFTHLKSTLTEMLERLERVEHAGQD